jgi:PhoPQ-activated pathogenicity-related protein
MFVDRRRFLELCTAGGLSLLTAVEACADLAGYVGKTDPSFAWKRNGKETVGNDTIHRLRLTSQTWQNIVWEHDLCLYVPEGRSLSDVLTLINTGGGADKESDLLVLEIARRAQAPIAMIYHIPNQPLLDGKTEDGLIAETFLRYLKTGDENWPLLFPMVKSVIRAMDVLQSFIHEETGTTVNQFIISGASKRGWTSWLTAASGDKRVKAIAPMVIDTLNMPVQIRHQRECYGRTSDQIDDYARNGLTDIFMSKEGKRLVEMVDPYAYRKHLTMPKLLIHGANDPYWAADALRQYWNDLPGKKWVCYVPNAGHNLLERTPGQTPSLDRAFNVLAAFIQSQSGGPELPHLDFTETDFVPESKGGQKGYGLRIRTQVAPTQARLWAASAETRDFRPSVWESRMPLGEGKEKDRYIQTFGLAKPASGYAACFGEVTFVQNGRTFTLCTPTRVV